MKKPHKSKIAQLKGRININVTVRKSLDGFLKNREKDGKTPYHKLFRRTVRIGSPLAYS